MAALAAAFASVFFYPAKGFSVEEDPYAFRTLIGTLYFEYEKSNYITDQYKIKNSHFTERYQIETKGNLISRRLLIYDFDTSYTNVNYDSSGSKTENDDIDYRIQTTFLPNSSIPLTLHGSRMESTSSSGNKTNTGTKTAYGLEWRLLTRTLPRLQLTHDLTETESANARNNTATSNLNIFKDIGPTTNEVFLRKNDSKSDSGDRSSNRQINATHGTKVSKSTSFSAGGSRSDSKDTKALKTTHEGYSFSLNSTPSKDFRQEHDYTYYKTSDNGRRDGSTYSGDMSYTVSKKLSTKASIGITNSESETKDSQQKSRGSSSSGGVTYKLTRTVSISESIGYNNNQTNSSSSTSTNTTDYKTFASSTTADYGDTFSWTSLGLSYGVTYTEEQVGEVRGTAVGQSAGIGLGNIDFNKYVGLSTSASFSETEATSGKTKTDKRAYSLNVFNKAFNQYVSLTGSANKTTTSSWIEGMDLKHESYRLDASSNIFKTVALTGFAERLKNLTEGNSWSIVDTEGVNLTHKNILFGGPLEFSASYKLSEREYSGGIDRTSFTSYQTRYSKPLLGLMYWNFDASITEGRADDQISRTSTLKNSVIYPIRAWLFSLDHRYILTETNTQDSNENVYMFKAMRTFIRVL